MAANNGTATIYYYEIANEDITGVYVSIEATDGSLSRYFANFDPEDATNSNNGVFSNQIDKFQVNVESFIAAYESNFKYESVESEAFEKALAHNEEQQPFY